MIKYLIKLLILKKKYRKNNLHNMTTIKSFCDISKIIVGKKTYGEIKLVDWSSCPTKLIIGSYCSIAPGVQFLLGGEHSTKTITTYPFKVYNFGQQFEASSKGDIIIKDDVWIGTNAIICSGITIGQGAVIAAGAIVSKDVPPYSIVGGNPAKVIKYRFTEDLINQLINIDIVSLFDSFEKNDESIIYSELTEDVLNSLKEKINGK